MRQWLATAGVLAVLIAAWLGCGGGPGQSGHGVPRLDAGLTVTAYRVSGSADAELADPANWTTRFVPTRIVPNFTISKHGYSTGRYRTDAFNAHGNYLAVDQSVDLRAAYSDTHLYLFVRWQDHSMVADTARDRWYVGAGWLLPDHFKEPDVAAVTGRSPPTDGFARHLDEDRLLVMFPIGDPTAVHDGVVTDDQGNQSANEAGALDRPFSQVGCLAACHAGPMRMAPAVGRVDIWNWSAGTSNALGYAEDQSGGGGFGFPRQTDGGVPFGARNGDVAPLFEYDPSSGPQLLTCSATGALLEVNPRSALLTGHTRPFRGTATRLGPEDPPGGLQLYGETEEGYGCSRCHGLAGAGGAEGAPALSNFALWDGTDRDARAELAERLASVSDAHYVDGRITPRNGAETIPADDVEDLAAYIVSMPPADPNDPMLSGGAGVPGVVLTPPTGSAADVAVLNASGLGGLTGVFSETTGTHTVILRRQLSTGDGANDITFRAQRGHEVPFGLAITDGDSCNHAGGPLLTLRFSG